MEVEAREGSVQQHLILIQNFADIRFGRGKDFVKVEFQFFVTRNLRADFIANAPQSAPNDSPAKQDWLAKHAEGFLKSIQGKPFLSKL